MSTILLFVTAKVPTKLINTFLTQHIWPEILESSIFGLVRTPSQPLSSLDIPGTEAPIQSFDTGFLNASNTSLWDMHTRYQSEYKKNDSATFISTNLIAVLDAKSEERGTVRLLYRSDDEGEKSWRVKFRVVGAIPPDLEEDEEIYFREDVVDGDGVLDMRKVKEILGAANPEKFN